MKNWDKMQKRRRQLDAAKSRRDNFETEKIKETLRKGLANVGCDLPFYEGLDSFKIEFEKHLTKGSKLFPNLEETYIVSESQYDDETWNPHVDPTWTLVLFEGLKGDGSYGKASSSESKGNLRGYCSFYSSCEKRISAVIVLANQIKVDDDSLDIESGYARMLTALLHEYGHLNDAEKKINIDPETLRFDLVAAEAYANCYALDRLADLSMYLAYQMLLEALEEASGLPGDVGDIGRLVVKNHVPRTIKRWGNYMEQAKESVKTLLP